MTESLSPQGAQQARCWIAADVLDRLPTPLLDDLRRNVLDQDAWDAACLNMALSGGERIAVRWLAKRVWPAGGIRGIETLDDVESRCDRHLQQALLDANTAITAITAMERVA